MRYGAGGALVAGAGAPLEKSSALAMGATGMSFSLTSFAAVVVDGGTGAEFISAGWGVGAEGGVG